MSPVALQFPVDAPPLQAPKYGLLISATVIDDGSDRWQGGVTLAPEQCGDADLYALCSGALLPGGNNRPAVYGYEPFAVVARDECSAFGVGEDEYRDRARRAIAAKAEEAVSREVWAGGLIPGNFHLASAGATVLGGGPQGRKMALALAVQAIADSGQGNRGMIHVRPLLAALLWGDQLLEHDGQRLVVAATQDVVVPGAGYAGTGPAGQVVGATEWIYATPWLTVRRGPVTTFPETLAEALDRSNDIVDYRAVQPFDVELNNCFRSAVEVTTANA